MRRRTRFEGQDLVGDIDFHGKSAMVRRSANGPRITLTKTGKVWRVDYQTTCCPTCKVSDDGDNKSIFQKERTGSQIG